MPVCSDQRTPPFAVLTMRPAKWALSTLRPSNDTGDHVSGVALRTLSDQVFVSRNQTSVVT
ncbi:unannotated protein [freshwater metagenome]|uniref:Unannotated protein n=1 Tax=freshwater metagenome TaxID=449393 RepID=A0A6J7A1E3_9ZZZZ